MGVLLTLPPPRLRMAKLLADAVLESVEQHGANYTGLTSPDRYFKGNQGEQAVAMLAKKYEGLYDRRNIGEVDSGDFIFKLANGMTIRCDVKTAGESFHKTIMMPQAQAAKYTYHVYIACRINEPGVVEIMGYLHPDEFTINDEFHSIDAPVPAVWQSFDNIMPIEFLLDRLAVGKLVEHYPPKVVEQFRQPA